MYKISILKLNTNSMTNKKLTKEQKHNMFKTWWLAVPNGMVRIYRDQIKKQCGITSVVFYHWFMGNSEIPTLALPIIEKIAGVEVFNENK